MEPSEDEHSVGTSEESVPRRSGTSPADGGALEASARDEPRRGWSKRAKATLAGATAAITLATGVLTLRDQLFPGGSDSQGVPDQGTVADITNDAEAKSWANRVSDGLKACAQNTGKDYEQCNTAGVLGALHVPIGFGVGSVEVDVTSPATFVLLSRSRSSHTFRLENFATGEQVRSCTPPGEGGCPPDGRW